MYLTADTLNANIEFDSPFFVDESGYVTKHTEDYAPYVEHSDTEDIVIHSDKWEAFSIGYTNQYGYNGAMMHASETLSGGLAKDILNTPGAYVVTTVEAPCSEDNPCFPDEPDYCANYGCDAEPAGWVVLKLKGDN